jgi:hypothetical protein
MPPMPPPGGIPPPMGPPHLQVKNTEAAISSLAPMSISYTGFVLKLCICKQFQFIEKWDKRD